MKAAIRRKYGSPNSIRIEEINKPVPTDDELLIKVVATTVNRTDCANLTAKPFIMRFILGLFKPKKIVLGTDFAGIVEAKGKNVSSFALNDRVYGFNDFGVSSQAEYITVKKESLILSIPENIGFQEAAASLEGASYAYSFAHKVSLNSSHKVLINGATGGIGSALLQFVKYYGSDITATCNTENIALIKSLGANKVYDYTKQDFTLSEDKFDYIFDAVGKSTFGQCKPLLKKGGIYSSSELGPYAQNLFFAIFSKRVIFPKPFPLKTSTAFIHDLLTKEKFKPVIDKNYTLDDISEAYEYVISGRKTGNVVINISNKKT